VTVLVRTHSSDSLLGDEVLAHLHAQLASARRLLQIVLEQGVAIRGREVEAVVRLAGILGAELERRQLLEHERTGLLERAGARLGVASGAVTLALLEGIMDPGVAVQARAASAELRGLLDELQREHCCNRAMMSQELAFLDHLLRFLARRRENASRFLDGVASIPGLRPQREIGASSWFGFGLTLTEEAQATRDEVVARLARAGVQTRPVVAGNFLNNPVMAHLDHEPDAVLPNAQALDGGGFYVGNHHFDAQEQIGALCRTLRDCVG